MLGWLNGYFGLSSDADIDWKDFGGRYLKALQDAFAQRRAQVGHVKLFLSTQTGTMTANLVSSKGPVAIRTQGQLPAAAAAEMTLNARVQMDPEKLQDGLPGHPSASGRAGFGAGTQYPIAESGSAATDLSVFGNRLRAPTEGNGHSPPFGQWLQREW